MKLMLLLCLLTTAAAQDIRSGKVSNGLIAAGLAIGAAARTAEQGACGIYDFLGNISIPVILLYLFFQMRVLGAGDIKLFSMIGGIVTRQELFTCMAYSFLAAGAGSVLFLAADPHRRKKLWQAVRYLSAMAGEGRIVPYRREEGFSFAFAVPVLFGTTVALFL